MNEHKRRNCLHLTQQEKVTRRKRTGYTRIRCKIYKQTSDKARERNESAREGKASLRELSRESPAQKSVTGVMTKIQTSIFHTALTAVKSSLVSRKNLSVPDQNLLSPPEFFPSDLRFPAEDRNCKLVQKARNLPSNKPRNCMLTYSI